MIGVRFPFRPQNSADLPLLAHDEGDHEFEPDPHCGDCECDGCGQNLTKCECDPEETCGNTHRILVSKGPDTYESVRCQGALGHTGAHFVRAFPNRLPTMEWT